jgi:RNA polymerase sigma factor (sigma-70 family)
LPGCKAIERCLHVAEQLNQAQSWGLTADELLRYAKQLTIDLADISHLSEDRIRTVINNYHADHSCVQALRDREHPQHEDQWNRWSYHIVRTLAVRLRRDTVDIATMSIEDLAQEAMSDLWLALPSFRYESRFQTWVFTVIANRIARAYRSANTQKRRASLRSTSLQTDDEMVQLVEASCSPEEEAIGSYLAALTRRVLAEHPDVRLQLIFHLWMHEDQPLREIGDRLNLSIPRVHALLSHALSILRSEGSIQAWQALNS